MRIGPISELAAISEPALVEPALVEPARVGSARPTTLGFGDMLQNLIQDVNADQLRADQGILDLSQGKTEDLQTVVMSVARADLSFRFFLEMRNKLTESYQELARMQF